MRLRRRDKDSEDLRLHLHLFHSGMKIFISYRRDDNHGYIGPVVRGIYERLSSRYGEESVFMDVDTIPPGVDFVEYLGEAVSRSEVLLAIIGDHWVELLQDRSEDEDDFVRIEIESALNRSIPVIPRPRGACGHARRGRTSGFDGGIGSPTRSQC